MWGALSDERTNLSFAAVIISITCHLYLQFYMSEFCIVVKSPTAYSLSREFAYRAVATHMPQYVKKPND
jgi:hypothetical protein